MALTNKNRKTIRKLKERAASATAEAERAAAALRDAAPRVDLEEMRARAETAERLASEMGNQITDLQREAEDLRVKAAGLELMLGAEKALTKLMEDEVKRADAKIAAILGDRDVRKLRRRLRQAHEEVKRLARERDELAAKLTGESTREKVAQALRERFGVQVVMGGA